MCVHKTHVARKKHKEKRIDYLFHMALNSCFFFPATVGFIPNCCRRVRGCIRPAYHKRALSFQSKAFKLGAGVRYRIRGGRLTSTRYALRAIPAGMSWAPKTLTRQKLIWKSLLTRERERENCSNPLPPPADTAIAFDSSENGSRFQLCCCRTLSPNGFSK